MERLVQNQAPNGIDIRAAVDQPLLDGAKHSLSGSFGSGRAGVRADLVQRKTARPDQLVG